MAEQLNPDELVNFKELLLANSMQMDAVTQLLIEKGIITELEFYTKLKKVQMEYGRNKND